MLSNVNDTFRDNFKLSPKQTPDCVSAVASLRSINDSERTYMNNIAILDKISMKLLQSQNVKRNIVKQLHPEVLLEKDVKKDVKEDLLDVRQINVV